MIKNVTPLYTFLVLWQEINKVVLVEIKLSSYVPTFAIIIDIKFLYQIQWVIWEWIFDEVD